MYKYKNIDDYKKKYWELVQRVQTEFAVTSYLVSGPGWVKSLEWLDGEQRTVMPDLPHWRRCGSWQPSQGPQWSSSDWGGDH